LCRIHQIMTRRFALYAYRKQERELLNKICIVSMLARLRLMPKGCAQ
ncbi:hypothetical protein FSI11_022815, partial [Escherichia coli]|nr:hypothetical protein [Escherichia coli]